MLIKWWRNICFPTIYYTRLYCNLKIHKTNIYMVTSRIYFGTTIVYLRPSRGQAPKNLRRVLLYPLFIYVQKEFHSYLHWFCVIALQSYREILKKLEKGQLLCKTIFNEKKTVSRWDNQIDEWYVKFQSCRPGYAVAIIEETHKNIQSHCA